MVPGPAQHASVWVHSRPGSGAGFLPGPWGAHADSQPLAAQSIPAVGRPAMRGLSLRRGVLEEEAGARGWDRVWEGRPDMLRAASWAVSGQPARVGRSPPTPGHEARAVPHVSLFTSPLSQHPLRGMSGCPSWRLAQALALCPSSWLRLRRRQVSPTSLGGSRTQPQLC